MQFMEYYSEFSRNTEKSLADPFWLTFQQPIILVMGFHFFLSSINLWSSRFSSCQNPKIYFSFKHDGFKVKLPKLWTDILQIKMRKVFHLQNKPLSWPTNKWSFHLVQKANHQLRGRARGGGGVWKWWSLGHRGVSKYASGLVFPDVLEEHSGKETLK